jgi:hypothetical protein
MLVYLISVTYTYNFFSAEKVNNFITNHGKVCDEGGTVTESSRIQVAAILSGLKG